MHGVGFKLVGGQFSKLGSPILELSAWLFYSTIATLMCAMLDTTTTTSIRAILDTIIATSTSKTKDK
jgi:hypothetical protein